MRKKLLLLVALFVLLIGLAIPIFMSAQTVQATQAPGGGGGAYEAPDWNKAETSLNLERVYVWIEEDCLAGNGNGSWKIFKRSVESKNNPKDFMDHADTRIILSDFAAIGNNTNPECASLQPYISEILFGSKSGMFDYYYSQGKDGKYYLKEKWVKAYSNAEDEPNAEAISNDLHLDAQLIGYLDSNGDPKIPLMYRNFALRDPFSACFKTASGSNELFKMEPIGGGKSVGYAYKSADSPEKAIQVGRIIEDKWEPDYFSEGGHDGEFTCEEFAGYIKSNPNWFTYVTYSEAEMKKYLDGVAAEKEHDAKISDMTSLLQSKQDVIKLCVIGSQADDRFKGLTINAQINSIAAGMVDDTAEFAYTYRVNSVDTADAKLNALSTAYIKDCVLKALPESQQILDRKPSGSGYDGTIDSTDSAEDQSCESGAGSLGWILCPVAKLLDEVLSILDSQVQKFLRVSLLSDKEASNSLKGAWVNLRNIAYIILIPMMLITVISTALGFQLLDSYTVKKAVPRMVMAIIFIALSWNICMFIISFGNVLGNGVQGIISQPFGTGDMSLADIIGEAKLGNTGGTGVILGVAGGAGAFLAGAASLGIIISSLGSVAIIIGIAFMLLVARQVIILGLVLAAPLAILAWIFPGNDKLWKFWWGAFSKLVFLFPVIQAMIAMGKVFSSIVAKM